MWGGGGAVVGAQPIVFVFPPMFCKNIIDSINCCFLHFKLMIENKLNFLLDKRWNLRLFLSEMCLYYFDVIANLIFCYIISAAIDLFSCLCVTDFVDITRSATTQLEFDFKIQIQSVTEEKYICIYMYIPVLQHFLFSHWSISLSKTLISVPSLFSLQLKSRDLVETLRSVLSLCSTAGGRQRGHGIWGSVSRSHRPNPQELQKTL